MKEILIERFCFSQEMGTFGYLTAENALKMYTCEEVWRSNVPNSESCIPEGEYELRYDYYHSGKPNGYPAYLVVNPALGVTVNRRILIHPGNTIIDSKACILPGMGCGFMKGKWAVTDSHTAFESFMRYMNRDINAKLVVRNLRPEYKWPPT